jgi:hypothetical protein
MATSKKGAVFTGVFANVMFPDELKSVLTGIIECLGPNVHCISADTKEIQFNVWGLSDDMILEKLKANSAYIFPASLSGLQSRSIKAGRGSFQIGLGDKGFEFSNPDNQQGVILRYLG